MNKQTLEAIFKISPYFKRCYTERNLYRETFMENSYKWLADKTKPHTTVLDFGTAIGDTAVYFAMLNNVDKVISFEINKEAYSWAKENVECSPYKGKITLCNEPAHIPKLIGKNTVIKCDIEGGEHQLFTDATGFNNVYAIMMEYHYGRQNLVKVLRAKGFKVKVIGEHEAIYAQTGLSGYIQAWR